MAGRLSVACASFLAVLAFLLLFASGSNVEAVTYKIGYQTQLSCDGTDGCYGDVKDGRMDVDRDGDVADDPDDDCKDFTTVEVIDGQMDIDDDGEITDADDGFFTGVEIIDGEIDIDDDGFITDADDGHLWGDDSCEEDPTYGPYGEDLTADMLSMFTIADLCNNAIDDDTGDTVETALGRRINDGCPQIDTVAESGDECLNDYDDEEDFEPDGMVNDGCPAVGTPEVYSNFSNLATMGVPAGWWLATDKEIPNGAFVGMMNAVSTLGLFGTACNIMMEVPIPMFDCTTDNSEGNQIAWDADVDGANLTYGHKSGLPAGCLRYPAHVDNIMGGEQPRARYYGFYIVVPGMAPTQLNFLMFSPEQLTERGTLPETDFADPLGYINVVVLDNPDIPAGPGGALEEFCTPLSTTTNLHGRTDGEGHLTQDVPPVPGIAGSYFEVTDPCGNGIDDNGDTRIDEFCGIPRVRNPKESTGVYGTGTHLAGAYSESYRDADGDTIPNNQDECPLQWDSWTDTDGDFIDDVCDPDPTGVQVLCPGPQTDCDNDGWSNQADNCPLTYQDPTGPNPQNDADDDGIGDACDNDDWDPLSDGPSNPRDRIRGLDASVYPPGEAACNDNVDDDDDGAWDDGCHLDSEFPNGPHLNDMSITGAICIGEADFDGDGWCDSTENLIGQGGQVLSVWNDITSTPEYYGIDFTVRAGDPPGANAPAGIEDPPGAAPGTCSNWDYYDVNSANPHGGAGLPVDDDGDTVVNLIDPDPNCVCNTAVDTDCDGVLDDGDGSTIVGDNLCSPQGGVGPPCDDNCWDDANPTQLDTDANCTVLGAPLECGDACDMDDDSDGTMDFREWAAGSDPKNICDPVNFDLNADGKINVLDVAFKVPMEIVNRTCRVPDDYTICEAMYRHDP